MTLRDYFLSPHGRISRQEYWLGMLALVAVSLSLNALIDPNAFMIKGGKVQPPSLAGTLLSLAIIWPSTAIAIKRFNDRDWPPLTGHLLGISMVVLVVANHLGLMLDHVHMSGPEKALLMMLGVTFIWSLIENGFKKGTSGPNRYGPDPLEPPTA